MQWKDDTTLTSHGHCRPGPPNADVGPRGAPAGGIPPPQSYSFDAAPRPKYDPDTERPLLFTLGSIATDKLELQAP